ncbi:hypothetical protein N1851_024755 [Merluccius polli]|uniref:RING-type domain-containing protein n=1 Tax=Merluccius polli TaxID=89951 RepID=A0AA47MEQ5_MERPO|nr:hypothetical protein N1851_024755 [Merluccius polli]
MFFPPPFYATPQVAAESIYLIDERNGAIFPQDNGDFTVYLGARGHYEPCPLFLRLTLNKLHLCRRSKTASTTGLWTFWEDFSEVVGNRLVSSKTFVIRFLEAEDSVEGITGKVREALASEEDEIILTDSQGNAILDLDGTRTSQYWRQNSRKVFALTEETLEEFQRGRRAKNSRRAEDSASAVLVDKVDDLKAAAEGLQTVAEAIRHLTNLARPALQPAKEAMKCLVCKAIISDPFFATCCGSMVGCKICVERWCVNSDMCLKCRALDFSNNLHALRGLSPALAYFKDIE